jgi:aminopeptidase YwaD
MRYLSKIALTSILIFGLYSLQAQSITKKQKQIAANLQKHIQFLASDALEGRRAGEVGEQKAVDYIVELYTQLGLIPAGENNGFVQNFPIDEGNKWSNNAFIKVNGASLSWDTDFITLSNTASGAFQSNAALVLNEAKQVWFKDLQEVLEENANNPHFDIIEWCKQTTDNIAKKGAIALFLYNSGSLVDNIQFNKYDTSVKVSLPVVYITKDGFKKHFKDETATYHIEANVAFEHPQRTAHNVIGYIDNHATNTVILGAHLDHLGYNQDKHGLDLNNDIHNGADDNASGTAALIELTKSLIKKSPKNNNYLIIHFSGEELGLLGSKYWLDHPTKQVTANYMINMDMVGRYDTARKLTLGGYGTSSKWDPLFKAVPIALNTHLDSAGTGPSDHASFYRKDMPVLFLFTGSHSDYHKATDDADKINYNDEAKMVEWLGAIIKEADHYGKFDFLKTREVSMGRSTKFTVSLGVMPDYAFTGTGVRIEGTSQGKLGEKIGLKASDVLLQLGDYKLIDVMSYMQALSKFKKGDKTVLTINRGKEQLQFNIEF